MIREDFIRFGEALAGLADYYGKPLSDGVINLYWQGLQAFEIDQVERAIWQHLQNPDNGQWMPRIADLVRALEGSSQDAAALAWGNVMQAVSRVGMHQSIAFDDPIIHLVIDDLGGWPGLCQTPEREQPFMAKRFEAAYRAYRQRGAALPPHPRHLAGVSEIANAGRGYTSDPPRLVGDPEAARRVMLAGTNAPRLQVTLGKPVTGVRLVHNTTAAA